MTQIKLEDYEGQYLPHSIIDSLSGDMDGTILSRWVNEQGYYVLNNFDTKRNGLVVFEIKGEVWRISTNGYVCKAL